MKILILANKLPYPPKDGGSIATLNMLTGLRDAGNDMTCLALNTTKHAFPVSQIPEEPAGTIRFMGVDCDNSIQPFRLILNLIFTRKPYIAERFNIPRFRSELCRLLRKENFDVIQLEGPYLGHYLPDIRKNSDALVSLRAHNVEHLIWKKKAANERGALKRWYLNNMANRLKKFEMKVAAQSNCLIPISPTDEAYFRTQGYNLPALTIPTGLDMKEYPLTPLPAEPTLFFIGALDWMPNQEGLLWFLDQIFFRALEKLPELTFHVAGRNAPIQFEKKLNHPRIIYHGEVNDARKFMQAYRVMVVPLLTGSGIRIKILEGMALGRPVLTSPTGIEGIPARNGLNVIATDDADQFTNQLVNLLLDKIDTARMIQEARDLIIQNFDTFGLSNRLSQFFKAQV